jgi:predicted transcriptional regulator
MTVRQIAENLGLSVCCAEENLDQVVNGAYTGDLLSDVMAHSLQGQVWVTIQVHMNIVAVAALKEHAAIVIVNGRTPAAETLARAAEEHIPVLTSGLSAFEVSGKLHALGVGGVTRC